MYTSVTSRRRKVFGENLLCFLRLRVSLKHTSDFQVGLRTLRSYRKRTGLQECRNEHDASSRGYSGGGCRGQYAAATPEIQWPHRHVKSSCSGAAHVHETFRETSPETPFQNRVSSFQCARTYPAPTEQKGGQKRTLGFPVFGLFGQYRITSAGRF